MTIYVRLEGRDTWHWHPKCRHLRSSKRTRTLQTKKPSGDQCNECKAKSKADAKSTTPVRPMHRRRT